MNESLESDIDSELDSIIRQFVNRDASSLAQDLNRVSSNNPNVSAEEVNEVTRFVKDNTDRVKQKILDALETEINDLESGSVSMYQSSDGQKAVADGGYVLSSLLPSRELFNIFVIAFNTVALGTSISVGADRGVAIASLGLCIVCVAMLTDGFRIP